MAGPDRPMVICTVITPIDRNSRLDEAAFRGHLRRMVAGGVGVYLGTGSAGEGAFLDADELAHLYRIGVEECKGKVPVYATPPPVRTANQMLRNIRLAADAGVEVLQLYQLDAGLGRRPGLVEQEQYFRDILEGSQHPVIITVHDGAGYMAPADLVIKLCKDYRQIHGVLLHGPPLSYFIQLKDAIRPDIRVYTGMDLLLGSVALGGWGCAAAEPNIAPRLAASILHHYLAGDHARARDAWAMVLRLNRVVWGGSGLASTPMIKGVLTSMGLLQGDADVRRPLLKADPEDVKRIVAALRALNIPELAN